MFRSRVKIVAAIAAVMAGCGAPPAPVVDHGVHMENTIEQTVLRHRETVDRLKKQQRDTDEWDRQFMSARYDLVVSLFNHASLYTQNREKVDKMKALLKEVEKICEDFMWKYDGYLVTFDLGTYRGRANVMLAEVAPTEVEREEYFNKALGGMAFQLSTDTLAGKVKEDRSLKTDAAIKEIIAKGYLHKMKALIGYGDLKKDGQYYRMAVDESDKAFSSYPDCLQEDLFLQIRLEQEKAGVKLESLRRLP